MILQGVKLTIQPVGVGYANRPKRPQMGGYVAFSPTYLRGFDLTTSVRCFFGSKSKKYKGFMVFDPKKKGSSF